MKKRQTALIVAVLILLNTFVGFSAINAEKTSASVSEAIDFSFPSIKEENEKLVITLPEATSYGPSNDGYLVPIVSKVISLPFKTEIKSVKVIFLDITEIKTTYAPKIATMPLTDSNEQTEILQRENDANMVSLFDGAFSYHVSAGRKGSEIVNYLVIQLQPIVYDERLKKVYSSNLVQIDISYDIPEQIVTIPDEYDLLIIAPQDFTEPLQPLVNHKNSYDIVTKLVTMEEIVGGSYTEIVGRDDAEQVKYFIRFALENWGIEYVLLVGGRNGGFTEPDWWVPVRYSDLDDGNEARYISDLYFSDIYDAEGNFSSWDENENDQFSEFSFMKNDIPDMYPDVAVGRLACRTKSEVATMVEKIITYETTTYGSTWFKQFIGISGDTYPGEDDPYFEGELATEVSSQLLSEHNFDSTFLWTSLGTFNGPEDVINAISEGAGFVHFSGHGNPYAWSNHPPNNHSGWINGPNAFEMGDMTNADKFPVVIVGGCHNGQFDVGLHNIVRDILIYGVKGYFFEAPFMFYHMEWIPRCWSWSLVNKAGGGGIAIISNTGLGYGIPGEEWNTGNGRWMEMDFFKSYTEGNTILGQAFSTNLINYMNEFYSNGDIVDFKIPQEWTLLGDPSLMIGGFE